jgi:hypothetical protein
MAGDAPKTNEPDQRAHAMMQGRQAESARRRQRVIAALNRAATDGSEISVSSIARDASIDRSFLYRHRDLLASTVIVEASPCPASDRGQAATTKPVTCAAVNPAKSSASSRCRLSRNGRMASK